MMGISEEWEREEVALPTEGVEEIGRRLKKYKKRTEKSYDAYLEHQFENRIKAKVHRKTKKLHSFMHFTELDGELDLTRSECLTIAAKFIQTYYAEFVPYLQVSESRVEESKIDFYFVIQKNGYRVENQFFYIKISRKTGMIFLMNESKRYMWTRS